MLATAVWDGLILHAIVKESEIRAMGVTTGVEVFNEIIDTVRAPRGRLGLSVLHSK